MCRRERQKEQKKLGDRDARCPFFVYHTQKNIVCEGPIPDTNIRIIFGKIDEKNLHFNLFCCGKWEYCEQARKAEEKYGDDE